MVLMEVLSLSAALVSSIPLYPMGAPIPSQDLIPHDFSAIYSDLFTAGWSPKKKVVIGYGNPTQNGKKTFSIKDLHSGIN